MTMAFSVSTSTGSDCKLTHYLPQGRRYAFRRSTAILGRDLPACRLLTPAAAMSPRLRHDRAFRLGTRFVLGQRIP